MPLKELRCIEPVYSLCGYHFYLSNSIGLVKCSLNGKHSPEHTHASFPLRQAGRIWIFFLHFRTGGQKAAYRWALLALTVSGFCCLITACLLLKESSSLQVSICPTAQVCPHLACFPHGDYFAENSWHVSLRQLHCCLRQLHGYRQLIITKKSMAKTFKIWCFRNY